MIRISREPLALLSTLDAERPLDELAVGEHYVLLTGGGDGLEVLPIAAELGEPLLTIARGDGDSVPIETVEMLMETGLVVDCATRRKASGRRLASRLELERAQPFRLGARGRPVTSSHVCRCCFEDRAIPPRRLAGGAARAADDLRRRPGRPPPRMGLPRTASSSQAVAIVKASRPARLLPPVGAKRVLVVRSLDEELLDVDLTDFQRFEDDNFVRLHVCACAHATLAFFEQLLGRRLRWAFSDDATHAPPVGPHRVPMPTTYVSREASRSVAIRAEAGRHILLALSRDIVAHETGHAILDAVAPDLYDAADPYSLTIHEAYGDIAGLPADASGRGNALLRVRPLRRRHRRVRGSWSTR